MIACMLLVHKVVGAISKDSVRRRWPLAFALGTMTHLVRMSWYPQLIHLIRNVRTAGAAGQHSVVYDL